MTNLSGISPFNETLKKLFEKKPIDWYDSPIPVWIYIFLSNAIRDSVRYSGKFFSRR